MTIPVRQSAIPVLSCIPAPNPASPRYCPRADLNENTRISWKYGCSRYTTGTPNVMVNGLQQQQVDSTWTLADWQALLNPLYTPTSSAKRAAAWNALHHRS
jgi:hypothetical protein